MTAELNCKCGLHVTGEVRDEKQAQVIAQLHEQQDWRRPYRHAASVVILTVGV